MPCAVLTRERQRIRLLHTVKAGDRQRPVKQIAVQHAFRQRAGERERVRLCKCLVGQRVFRDGLGKLDRRLRRYRDQHHKI